MKPRLRLVSRVAHLALAVALPLLLPATRLRASAGYTITKIVDQNTPVPDRPGQTFTGLENSAFGTYAGLLFALDGNTFAFSVEDSSADGSTNIYSIWSVSATGGVPRRLADNTTAVPGGNGALFTEVEVRGIGGGQVVFYGVSAGGDGLYSVPVGGGAITTLADYTIPAPGLGVPFSSNRTYTGTAVHGAQVLFSTLQGIYFVPVTGGTITRFGDSSMTLLAPGGNAFSPIEDENNAPDLPGVDFGGGTVAFVGKNAQGNNPDHSTDAEALFTAPASGLTVSANGTVTNANFIADGNTAVPGDSGRMFRDYFIPFVDASATAVFYGSNGDVTLTGPALFSLINQAIVPLAGPTTVPAGGTANLTNIEEGSYYTLTLDSGLAYFRGTLAETDPNGNATTEGLFSVPVLGGAVTPVMTEFDAVPGTGGRFFSGASTDFGSVSAGKVAFAGAYFPAGQGPMYGLYLASPGGAAPVTDQLILSAHVGGDTGPVTVTATIVPGEPALLTGATVALVAAGQPNIPAQSVTVAADGSSLTAVIDLHGQALGTYDFAATNPDGTTITQAATFKVETGVGPVLYGDLLGRPALHAGKPQPYTIIVGNRGDVDAAGVPVFINFPSIVTAQVVTPLMAPFQAGVISGTVDYSQFPVAVPNGDHNVLPLLVPRVPAGGVVAIQVLFTAPDDPQYAHELVDFGFALGEPWIDAETGQVAMTTSSAKLPGGEHIDAKIGLPATCALSLFNFVVDCASIGFPPLRGLKCGGSLILNGINGLAGVASDSANNTNAVISQSQAAGGIASGILTCVANALGGALPPGFGTATSIVNCALDAYLLAENCIAPATPFIIKILTSGDPNDLSGSVGDGSASHYLTGAEPLRYVVDFENEDTATAPAQSVTITNPLDANLNLSTFSLGPIGFGSTVLIPPSGAQNYSTTVDLRPATNLLVQVTATLNTASRSLSYSFVSLDPATNRPTTDPSAGFLPPDVNAPAGDGFVVFYAKPNTGLSTGTAVNDQASIVFDANPAIATPVWTNTIDNDAPISLVTALPKKEKVAQIPLQLTSTDNGSGAHFYNVYVSEDGGAFQPLLTNAVGPAVTYTGVTGHSYSFFSQAVDGAGNIEPLKTVADASTKIRGADLIGQWKGDVTAKTNAKGRVKLSGKFKVTNQSPQKATSAGAVVRFYLSADGTFDASDPVVGQDLPFDVLAPGAGVALTLTGAKLPVGMSASGMFLIAVIDPEHTLTETDTTNNTVVYGPFP